MLDSFSFTESESPYHLLTTRIRNFMTMLRKTSWAKLVLGFLALAGAPLTGHVQETESGSDGSFSEFDLVFEPDSPLDLDSAIELDSFLGLEEMYGVQEADAPYVPTPEPVVNRMLEAANVDANDVVYDLGSGDGRIVIQAARQYGARGVGIEIDPDLVKKARRKAHEAGVADRVEFRQADLFETDLSEATVLTLYLLSSVNRKLRPKLFEELAPGTPVVSHAFDMGEWEPEETVEVDGNTIYRWTITGEIPGHLKD